MGPLVPDRFLHQPRLVSPRSDENDNSSKNCASLSFSLHSLASDTLVPPVCPVCGAPGLHSRPIPGQVGGEKFAPLQAHYCDLCAQSLENDSTRRLANALAATIIAVAFATALTFFLGLRLSFIQWWSVLLVSVCLPLLGKRYGAWRVTPEAVEEVLGEGQKDGQRTLLVKNDAFARALSEAALPAIGTTEAPHVTLSEKFQQRWPIWLVPTLALSWWTLLHVSGVAQVRVLYGGERSATLLIDGRHSGVVSAAHSEDPESGGLHQVLGGRRTFALVSSEGELLAERSETLWPGRTYIVGVLPPGSCLFSETLDYGKEGEGNLFVPLEGSGPLWEVKGRVDSWFQALAPRGQRSDDEPDHGVETAEQSLSGGTRRAIRLLPCRPHAGL
jgi:hypothetical protein